MTTYPESLLAAARAVKQIREDRSRRSQQTTSYLFGGDSRPSEIMVRDHLAERAESRRHREVEAHYERELAAYEASQAGTMISGVTGMKAYNMGSPEGRAAFERDTEAAQ